MDNTREQEWIFNAERCVCCGAIIPEGTMVCSNCLVAVKEGAEDGKRKTLLDLHKG